jgi:hypothetical protein
MSNGIPTVPEDVQAIEQFEINQIENRIRNEYEIQLAEKEMIYNDIKQKFDIVSEDLKKGLPEETERKSSKASGLMMWAFALLLIGIATFMYFNMAFFFIQLGNQTIGTTLVNWIVIMTLWNVMITPLFFFGARDSIHNIKMLILRRQGWGYEILLDRDRGIKKFVTKINKKYMKIMGKLYFTNRKRIRLWENRIPTYIHEAGMLEPSAAGLEDKATPVDSDEYQTTVELAESAGKKKAGKGGNLLFFAVIGALIFAAVAVAMSYQNGQKLDILGQMIAQTYQSLQGLQNVTSVTVLPSG